jgi:hypothetical protein
MTVSGRSGATTAGHLSHLYARPAHVPPLTASAPNVRCRHPSSQSSSPGPLAVPRLPPRVVGVEVRAAERLPAGMVTAFDVAARAMALAYRCAAIRAWFWLRVHASTVKDTNRGSGYTNASLPPAGRVLLSRRMEFRRNRAAPHTPATRPKA